MYKRQAVDHALAVRADRQRSRRDVEGAGDVADGVVRIDGPGCGDGVAAHTAGGTGGLMRIRNNGAQTAPVVSHRLQAYSKKNPFTSLRSSLHLKQ